jgi:tetratricopeptide (TPR) repeat protein
MSISAARALKEEGSALFKVNGMTAVDAAVAKWNEALMMLASTGADSDDEDDGSAEAAVADASELEASELKQSCHLNCAICHLKQDNFKEAAASATDAVKLNPQHVKALFTRGKAYVGLKRLSQARADLLAAAKLDPTNKPLRKLFDTVAAQAKAADEKAKLKRKKNAGFLDAGNTLYDEKKELGEIKEKNRVKENEEAKKKAKEDAAKKKKEKKEKEAKDGPAVASKSKFNPGDANDYSKWNNLDDTSSEDEAPVVKKAEPDAPRRPPPRSSKPSKDSDGDDDSDSDDAKGSVGDFGARGYKIRADGSKTSFFDNEMDEKTKALIGDITPQKLTSVITPQNGGAAGSNGGAAGPAANERSGASAGAASSPSPGEGSAWNSAGSWEERDRSAWAKARLEELLGGLRFEAADGSASVSVTSVKKMEGSATVALVRGTARFFFEFSAELEWAAAAGGGKCKGTLSIEDLSSDCAGEFDMEVGVTSKGKSAPAAGSDLLSFVKGHVRSAVAGLQPLVVEQMALFAEEFKGKA